MLSDITCFGVNEDDSAVTCSPFFLYNTDDEKDTSIARDIFNTRYGRRRDLDRSRMIPEIFVSAFRGASTDYSAKGGFGGVATDALFLE
jgi:hypothetical protein